MHFLTPCVQPQWGNVKVWRYQNIPIFYICPFARATAMFNWLVEVVKTRQFHRKASLFVNLGLHRFENFIALGKKKTCLTASSYCKCYSKTTPIGMNCEWNKSHLTWFLLIAMKSVWIFGCIPRLFSNCTSASISSINKVAYHLLLWNRVNFGWCLKNANTKLAMQRHLSLDHKMFCSLESVPESFKYTPPHPSKLTNDAKASSLAQQVCQM